VIGPGDHYSIIEHQFELEDELVQYEQDQRLKLLKGMLPLSGGLKGLFGR
jgi:hypothetical protein